MPDSLYDQDYVAWTQAQAAVLRAEAHRGNNAPVDWERVAEEIEDMGKRDRRELESRLLVLTAHLLKWLYCPHLLERNRRPWLLTILEQRRQLLALLTDSPSLWTKAEAFLLEGYEAARKQAAIEAEMPLENFPAIPPFTYEQAMAMDFPDALLPDHLRR